MPPMSPFGRNTTASNQWLSVQSLQSALEPPIQFVGFWTAVLIPFVLLALVASGVAQQSPLLLAGLLATDIFGLVLGKGYKR